MLRWRAELHCWAQLAAKAKGMTQGVKIATDTTRTAAVAGKRVSTSRSYPQHTATVEEEQSTTLYGEG